QLAPPVPLNAGQHLFKRLPSPGLRLWRWGRLRSRLARKSCSNSDYFKPGIKELKHKRMLCLHQGIELVIADQLQIFFPPLLAQRSENLCCVLRSIVMAVSLVEIVLL